ncbi:MAG: transporter [Oscillatoriales cyanobacterium SM2_2_1]|nr:transporter [Oscillatoriales cyanobacterium SM2_2_1]
MSPAILALHITAILLSIGGQFLLKAGALSFRAIALGDLADKFWVIVLNPFIWGGLSLYGISAAGYIVVLSRAPLSIAAPLISVSYIFTVVGGAFFFGEPLPPLRLVGVFLIMMGVVLVVNAK